MTEGVYTLPAYCPWGPEVRLWKIHFLCGAESFPTIYVCECVLYLILLEASYNSSSRSSVDFGH